MRQVLAITRKELEGYFGSPMALIFVGAYLAVTLFVFFWADAFFARGLADVRPLFRWTPVLLIFLVAALTMRPWSEEQRSGTLELLLTLPLSPTQLVLAKFLAVMAQVTVALALTIFLPITVSLLGDLDWGPVIGGYLAAVLLAAAYAALGLLISSRTDNQIVALIATALGCGLLYLLGSPALTAFFGGGTDAILRALGTGSRFESIQRGVVDLRDLVYYLSLTTLFLSLNVLSLASLRWSRGAAARPQRVGLQVTSGLLALNLLLLNVWLYPLRGLRLDLTAQRQYTLSRATRELLAGLQEPLLIRGYFSENTHPLLAPLVPTIRDMLEEYRIAGGGKVQVEVIDPIQDPEKESEANQVYGIQPTPFQVQGRYETSIVNSYFDILVRYGDQSATLGFRDLIEMSARGDGTLDVGLRNLEYDLTRTIKKVAYGFQSVEAVLASLSSPARLTLYVTPDTLPAALAEAPETIRRVAEDLARNAGGQFVYEVVDVDASPNAALRQTLLEEHGIQPLAASLFSLQTFYLHMVLQAGERSEVLYPSGDLSEANVKSAIESALKRSAPGFLQVVGLWTPPQASQQQMYSMQPQSLSSWITVGQYLRQEYEVRTLDLMGEVPAEVDVLLVVAPQSLSDVQRYAVDQYLMRGGTVIVAAGNYGVAVDPFSGGLVLQPLEDGLREMLAHYGVQVEQSLVMDPQNEPFPVTVAREVGGLQFQEIRAISYPFFVDVRSDGMAAGHPIVSNLPAVTLNWVSPVSAQEAEAAGRQVTTLLQSSPKAWTQASTDIQPNMTLYPELGFPQGEDVGRKTLAVVVQGAFDSAFQGQEPPQVDDGSMGLPTAPIPRSPESARLVVLGSAEFLDDLVFDISSRMTMDRYLNNLTLMQNAVAWATEDQALLEIRARGSYTRMLRPLSEGAQSFWEGANYVAALLALLAIGATWRARQRSQQALALLTPEELDREEEVTA